MLTCPLPSGSGLISPNVLHVLKRWAAWLLGGIAALLLALAVGWVLFVPAADWLAHHDVGSAKGAVLQTARDAARGRLLTLGAGLLAAGALLFTARNFTLSREGQVTDRYTKAIEQLGSDKLGVRLGGIYALERIARDSARDHPTVMEVLAAFIREQSSEPWPPSDPGHGRQIQTTRPDVQAAVTVIGRRKVKRDIGRTDLSGAILVRADLGGADLTHVNLLRADLRGADLSHARGWNTNLSGADLTGAHLSFARLRIAIFEGARLPGASLRGASLRGAAFFDADLTRADLRGARLVGAYFLRANLTGADLGDFGTNLTRADLEGANLTGADLSVVDLTGADLTSANLTQADLRSADLGHACLADADLTGARWLENMPVPEGWKLDVGTGRLSPAGANPGPAEAK